MSCHSKNNKGFTLVEILITIFIVTVILTVVVTRQPTYTEGVTITNIADQIGTAVSQAQTYSIGVRELSPGSNNFSTSYGLALSLTDTDSANSYIYFVDRNGNGYYDSDWSCPVGGLSECLEKIVFPKGYFIESLCTTYLNANDWCRVRRVDVTFLRPSTEAKSVFTTENGQSPPQVNDARYSGVKLELRGPSGLAKAVIIDRQSGLISIP